MCNFFKEFIFLGQLCSWGDSIKEKQSLFLKPRRLSITNQKNDIYSIDIKLTSIHIFILFSMIQQSDYIFEA